MNKRLILGVAVLLVFGTQSFAQNERVLGPLGKNFVTTVFEEASHFRRGRYVCGYAHL